MLTQINTTLFRYKKMERILPNQVRSPRNKMSSTSPILESLGPYDSIAGRLESLSLSEVPIGDPRTESVHLLNEEEKLLINSEQDFIERLKIDPNDLVKVVSIFGNTGEGKSHTLNHTFFDGKEIFKTSPYQNSCTIGVWAKYDPTLKMICIDTEGFLGTSKKELQRMRLLLKILAISDVIIYRTKSERLHSDMYKFLGGASTAFREHFSPALQTLLKKYDVEKSAAAWGPSVIIFHETRYANTLNSIPDVKKSPEDLLRETFGTLDASYDGFSSLKYIGFRSSSNGATSFKELRVAVEKELESSHIRSPRLPKYIYLALKAVNEKFQSQICDISPQLYLSAFFTCQDKCLSCGAGCSLSMGHKDEDKPHHSEGRCKLQHQYQNFVYICKKCFNDGIREVVKPSYQARNEQFWSSIISTVWSGYVIECPKCGKIYQSREYWYGNKDPKDEAVVIDIIHVWPGQTSLLGSQNSAQKVLDGVTSISNVVASVGSQPTKMLTDWMTDQIAPSYWKPNNEIVECYKCKVALSNATKHHCRACGEGFCETCSSKAQPVPSRGWYENVRVCDDCYTEEPISMSHLADGTELRTRRIGESVINSISAVKSILDKPKEMIKDTARPSYWIPDNECINCAVCDKPFGVLLNLHHCRDCGKGVCDKCSTNRKPVELRGWETPVRVCDNCSS